MKKLMMMVSVMLLTLMVATPIFATTASEEAVRLYDAADLLTAEEEVEIEAALDEISVRQAFDVIIATAPSYEGVDIEAAAETFFDANGVGYGKTDDGILLFVSMAERELNVYVDGYGMTAFTIFGREQLVDELTYYLSSDDFYGAFSSFGPWCDDFVTQAKAGTPYNEDHPAFELTFGEKVTAAIVIYIICMVIGAIIALIIMLVARGKLISVTEAYDAADYVRAGSLKLTREEEVYVRTDVDKRPKPKENKSGEKKSTSKSTSGSF